MSAKGAATWILRYRTAGAKSQKEITLGRYPDISLAEARKIATTTRTQVQQGIDVARQKQVARKAAERSWTIKKVADDYLEKSVGRLAPSTIKNREQQLRNYVLPIIGHLSANEVSAADIVERVSRKSLHVVETVHRGTKGYRFSYLQESDDIKTEIQRLKDPNNPEPLIDLVFYRLYDHYFARGFDVELFNILQDKFGHDAIQAYLTRRQACSSAIFKAELSDLTLLSDKACWNRFIADKEKILKNALELMNFYHDWWLLGIGKEKSEPEERVEKFGILEHIENTTLSELKKLKEAIMVEDEHPILSSMMESDHIIGIIDRLVA